MGYVVVGVVVFIVLCPVIARLWETAGEIKDAIEETVSKHDPYLRGKDVRRHEELHEGTKEFHTKMETEIDRAKQRIKDKEKLL